MDLRRLRYFVAVAEELNFTRAAERLYTSQPSLSEQIRSLEDTLGVVLLIRSPRKVELTEVGQVFLDEARQVLRQVERALSKTRAASQKARESLTIGFVPSAEVQIFPIVIPALRLRYPQVQIILKSLTPPEQQAALEQGEIDIAFTRPPMTARHIHSEAVLCDELRVFIRDDHPLADSPHIHPRQLGAIPQVRTDPAFSGALSQTAEKYLSDYNVPAEEALVSSNILTSMNLVAGGFGFALLPAYAEAFSPRNVVSRPVTGEPPTLDLIMAHNLHADDRLASLMTLMDLVRDSVQALA